MVVAGFIFFGKVGGRFVWICLRRGLPDAFDGVLRISRFQGVRYLAVAARGILPLTDDFTDILGW